MTNYPKGKFPQEAAENLVSKFYSIVYDSGVKGQPLVNDPCVDLVYDLECLWEVAIIASVCCPTCKGSKKVETWVITGAYPTGRVVMQPCEDCKDMESKND